MEEQAILRDQINEQQKTLAEMRQHRENSEKKSADEREQAVELKKGKWFGGGDRIPEPEDMLDPQKLGEMLRELDLEFRRR